MSLGKMHFWVIVLTSLSSHFSVYFDRKKILFSYWLCGAFKIFLYSLYIFQLSSVEDLVLINYLPIEVGNGNPLQYSCLENSMDRGAWWATVHGVTKSQTQLSNWALSMKLSLYTCKRHTNQICRIIYICNNRNIYIFDEEVRLRVERWLVTDHTEDVAEHKLDIKKLKILWTTSFTNQVPTIYKTGPINFCSSHLGRPTEVTIMRVFQSGKFSFHCRNDYNKM